MSVRELGNALGNPMARRVISRSLSAEWKAVGSVGVSEANYIGMNRSAIAVGPDTVVLLECNAAFTTLSATAYAISPSGISTKGTGSTTLPAWLHVAGAGGDSNCKVRKPYFAGNSIVTTYGSVLGLASISGGTITFSSVTPTTNNVPLYGGGTASIGAIVEGSVAASEDGRIFGISANAYAVEINRATGQPILARLLPGAGTIGNSFAWEGGCAVGGYYGYAHTSGSMVDIAVVKTDLSAAVYTQISLPVTFTASTVFNIDVKSTSPGMFEVRSGQSYYSNQFYDITPVASQRRLTGAFYSDGSAPIVNSVSVGNFENRVFYGGVLLDQMSKSLGELMGSAETTDLPSVTGGVVIKISSQLAVALTVNGTIMTVYAKS